VNKNNYYMVKGRVPDYLPNKPTVVASRGGDVPQGYFNKPIGSGISNNSVGTNLPTLSNPYVSSVAQNSGQNRNKSLPAYGGYKYGGISGGIGGGIGGVGFSGVGNTANENQYEQSTQGAQGSIGSSSGLPRI
jgi:hypothetical protein